MPFVSILPLGDRGCIFCFPHHFFPLVPTVSDRQCTILIVHCNKYNLSACFNPLLSRCVFQRAEDEDEESQVRKPPADLCSPSSKLAESDPGRKVSRRLPPLIHQAIPPSPPLSPLLYTQVSSQGHHPPTHSLPDRHTPCSPIHSGTLLLSVRK